ncbi:MAG: Transcriptional regulator, MarR family [Rickettsiales bacterium]|jgi:DNA-binding MarR family transcriptional regulator|nr:Transcriptional regulator, MarR family [Rickettsiales bacterium]
MQDDPNQSFGFVIHDIARMLRRNFDRRAQSLGLTRAQWSVLLHLRRQDGMRQTDLACLLEVKPISLTRLIDRLAKNGWVERRSDPDDRRANRIFLTEKVKPLVGQLREIGKETREEALIEISLKEQEALMNILLRIRATVMEQASPVGTKANNKGKI